VRSQGKKVKAMIKNVFLTISIILNIVLGVLLLLYISDAPTFKPGILTKEVVLNYALVFPKGTKVLDASPRGLSAIGQFQPYRFAIFVSASDSDLVKYKNLKQIDDSWGLYPGKYKR
jgi:hypothetical protein